MQAHIIILSIDFLFYHLIWFMAYGRWNLEIRISRNLLQNPKEGHYEALKDLKDTEIETLWFGFWLKKAKLNSCYQPCHTISWFFWYIKTFCCGGDIFTVLDLIAFVIIHKMDWIWEIWAFSSSLPCAIITCNHLPFFKIFCPFLTFFYPFSEKLQACPYFLE